MRFPLTLSLIPLAVFALFLTTLAHADFQAGKDAYYRGDYEMAFKEWQPLAEQGDAKAQGLLGLMYFKGQGVLKDPAQAADWYRKSAEQGNAEAQAKLSVLYLKGRGVPQDAVQAHMWNNLAAAQGHKPSLTLRDLFAREMTQGQIAEAQRLASQWKPKTGSAPARQPDLNETHEQVDWTQQLFNSIHYDDKHELIVDIDQVELSLANGANPNWISRESKKELSILGKFVRQISLAHVKTETVSLGTAALRLLFQNGAKLQSCDKTILYFPISFGHYEIVKLLLENGANATSWPKYEIGPGYIFDPIEEAAANGHDQIVDLLVSYGAKNLKEGYRVQIQFIQTATHGTVLELKALLKKGARISEKNSEGETALMNALQGVWYSDTLRNIIFLLDSGADPNQKAEGGFAGTSLPLHSAVAFSSIIFEYKTPDSREYIIAREILSALLLKGAFISGRDEDDKTPLHIAAEKNNILAAQLLLELDAKVNPKDKSGKTPFDYAESGPMIRLLKENGATEG
jgi:ankyrin repeat protein